MCTQIEEHIRSLSKEKLVFDDLNQVKALYESYYKEKYGLNSYEEFEDYMRHNSLYFISKDEKSYNKYVTEMINYLFPEEKDKSALKVLYRYAKDMEHSSGYNFNMSEGLWTTQCLLALHYVFKCLLMYMFFARLTMEEHNINVDIQKDMNLFKEIASVFWDEYVKTVQSYNPKE